MELPVRPRGRGDANSANVQRRSQGLDNLLAQNIRNQRASVAAVHDRAGDRGADHRGLGGA
eukprot:1159723-Lingulodinium_polyedra.AAC.1